MIMKWALVKSFRFFKRWYGQVWDFDPEEMPEDQDQGLGVAFNNDLVTCLASNFSGAT